MVQKILTRSILKLLVLPDLNYRTVEPKGVETKIDILYRSTVDDESTVRGWRKDLVAEIISLDNPCLYKMPKLVKRGLKNADQLRKFYADTLTSKITVAKSREIEYRDELVAVLEEMLANVEDCTEGVIAAVHRSIAMPDVIAKWRHDKLKHDETIPVELYNPATFDELYASVHRRNGQEMNQVPLSDVDHIEMALFFKKVKMSNQRAFRIFASTGSMNFSEAEKGDKEDQGGKWQTYWLVAEIADKFPELKIIERLGYPVEGGTEEEKQNRIDFKRLQQGPLTSGDAYRNLQVFRFCSHPDLRELFSSSSRGKAFLKTLTENSKAGPYEIGKMLANGIYWDKTTIEQWWNNQCPGRFEGGAMPSAEGSKTTVKLERVQNVARDGGTELIRQFAKNMLEVDGKESQIANFQQDNGDALKVADAFFRLVRDDVGIAAALLKIATGMEAVKIKDVNAFRKGVDDLLTHVEATVKTLASAAESAPPSGRSKSNPPSGKSKSAKTAKAK